jgi:hypothetical protein
MIDAGNVTSPPSRNWTVAISPDTRCDLTDIVRPFLKTTISARAALANANCEMQNAITHTPDRRAIRALNAAFCISIIE